MASGSRLKSFRRIKQNLAKFDIIWNPKKGKGSHGSFVGPHLESARSNAFPIPKSQQREINLDYVNGLRRRFGVTDKKWDTLFD